LSSPTVASRSKPSTDNGHRPSGDRVGVAV
jgi:hypothetical protein